MDTQTISVWFTRDYGEALHVGAALQSRGVQGVQVEERPGVSSLWLVRCQLLPGRRIPGGATLARG